MAAINKNFVVKNGIEVGDNLIYGNKDQLRVGVGTTTPAYTLDVRGGIGATNVSVGQTITANVGVITSLQVSSISFGGTTGISGQYLKSTGTGAEWTSFPTARTSTSFTATEGQTSFSFSYNVGFVDVFLNGVRLTDSEFTATNGISIILDTPCRDGDIVDIIGYSIIGVGAGTSGIGGITILDEGILVGSPNAITSLNFVGASVNAVGTGAGVTITISSGVSTGTSQWVTTATGIHTLSNVGVGTTNSRYLLEVGSVGASGTSLFVNGDARITGILTVGSSSIKLDGQQNTITVGSKFVANGNSGNVSIGGTISVDGGVRLTTNNATIVGTSGTAGEIKQIGGALFFYDGSAWREFVLSSGTPVSVPADTEWDNVILRCTFDTDFTDSKFNVSPVAIGTGSTITASPLKIGTGAFRSSGTGIGVSYAYRPEYDFTGPWTIEFWMYVDSLNFGGAQGAILVSSNSGINTNANWALALNSGITGNPYFAWVNQNHPSNSGGAVLQSYSGLDFNAQFLDKWNHIALVRESDNGSLHFYINGQEVNNTNDDEIIDNDILNVSGTGLNVTGGPNQIGTLKFDFTFDGSIDDLRITKDQRYTSVGIATTTTFTPPTTALPTTGTLSSYVQPPGDKYGEITLGGSPTWRGTSGVTVTQQSSGNYRVSFASTYTNSNDYYVLSQGMDQGFASYVGIARSTTHVDFAINRQSNDAAVDTGSLSVQIKNHI
jgi:hypothetical protein